MSESAGEITYTVDMETSALMKSTEKTDENLDKLQKGFDKTDAAAKKFGNTSGKAANEVRPLTSAIRGANDEAAKGAGIFGKFGSVIGAFAGISAAQQILQMTESYGEMSERVQMATKSQAEFEMVQQRLLASANETYRSLKQTQETYILTASSLRSMGYDANQALEVTESLALSFVKNATSVARADNAISAFSKSLSKGKVEADSWESIIVAIPSIADDMALSLGKSSAEIRKMGAEGKITANQLSTGLRASLDANREAAAGMATTVKDAYTQLTNNLSVFLGEANKTNEVTATMSLALQGVAANIETISKVLASAGVGALAAYIAKQTMLIATSARTALQSRAVAVAELDAAKAHMAVANAALAQAQAYSRLGAGSAALVSATNAQAAAATRLAAAQAGVAGASRILLGALGGPVGIIALAASAAAGLYLFRDSADSAAPSVDELAKKVEDLSIAQAELQKIQLDKAISELERLADGAFKSVQQLESLVKLNPTDAKFIEMLAKQRVELEKNTLKLQEYAKRRQELASYVQRPIDQPSSAPVPEPTTSTEGQKRLYEMRQELELMKLSGEARAKLQAIQKLGENATKEERAEAEKLAITISDLEKKHKDLEEQKRKQKQADADAKKGAEDNAKAIKDLTNEITMASLKGVELAQVSAVLKLNEYATPEQIEQVKKLAAELYKVNETARMKKEFGVDVKGKIMGEVDPLTGGPFDDQTARYDAEAQAEQKRYADQLERLKQAKALELEVVGGYQALEQKMAQEHADRMMQIEMAKKQVMLSAIESSFGAATDAIGDAFGKQSGIYKAAFVAQKIAAIAQATLAIQTGIAMASANPFPYNLAAMASVAAATAGIISNIQSISMGGGRQYGGPVQPNAMHRVNENGKPEIFNAANGRQYMIPNQRGEVVSNRDASRSGSRGNSGMTVTIGNITLPGVTNQQEGIRAAGAIGRTLSAQLSAIQRYN